MTDAKWLRQAAVVEDGMDSPRIARILERIAARYEAMERALIQFSKCDLSDTNCADFDVANRRIRNIALHGLKEVKP